LLALFNCSVPDENVSRPPVLKSLARVSVAPPPNRFVPNRLSVDAPLYVPWITPPRDHGPDMAAATTFGSELEGL
jgi:hypothetical protein